MSSTWRKRLRTASFRGVIFYVDVAAGDTGRQTVVHKVPESEAAPYIEDMGFDGDGHNIEAFVLGDDYMDQRDLLIGALRQPGPGPLIHPTLGARTVSVVGRASWREEAREGRMARFTITFVDSIANPLPSTVIDTSQELSDNADATELLSQTALTNKFSVLNKPQWVADAAKSKLQQLNDALTAARQAFPTIPASVTQFVAQAQQVSDTAASLIAAPVNLAASIVGLVALVALLPQQPRDALSMLESMLGFGDDDAVVNTGSLSRTTVNTNAAAFNALTQQAALAESARILPTVTFASSADIAGVRTNLLSNIEKQLLATDDDGVFTSFMDLRDAILDHLDQTAAQLPQLVPVKPPVTVPALRLAYQLYQDATRDQEIVDRNHIVNPGFVPGGEVVQVLNV